MGRAIKHALANLTNFSGRDARQAFWYYVLFLFIINIVVGLFISIPMMVTAFQSAFEAAQSGMTEDEVAVLMTEQMSGQMGSTMWASLALNLLLTCLIAASFVRCLHDSDHSGWWAVLAVVAQLGAAAFTITQIGKMQELMAVTMNPHDMAAYFEGQSQMYAYGLVGWIAPIIVIVFGIMKSTDGPNRFGEEPFTA